MPPGKCYPRVAWERRETRSNSARPCGLRRGPSSVCASLSPRQSGSITLPGDQAGIPSGAVRGQRAPRQVRTGRKKKRDQPRWGEAGKGRPDTAQPGPFQVPEDPHLREHSWRPGFQRKALSPPRRPQFFASGAASAEEKVKVAAPEVGRDWEGGRKNCRLIRDLHCPATRRRRTPSAGFQRSQRSCLGRPHPVLRG